MRAITEIITPELANEYLAKNTSNYRNLNRYRVLAYAEDMRSGRWEFNGESIKFNKSGNLVDGQHRLAAIVKAETPIQMLVVYDVDDDVKIYDIAQSRTLIQIAQANGIDGNVASSSSLSVASILLTPEWKTHNIPKGKVINYVKTHYEEFDFAVKVSRLNSSSAIAKKGACIAAIYCMIRLKKYQNSLYPFFGVVNSGFPINDMDCSSAIVFRNYLLSTQFDRLSSVTRNQSMFALTFQAMDDFENGRSRKRMYKPDYDLADKIKNDLRLLDGLE